MPDFSVPAEADVLQSIDKEKLQNLNICQYWPAAKAFLQGLLGATGSPWLKIAIPIIISVGNAACPGQ